MRKPKLFFTIAGAVAVCLGVLQVARRSAPERKEDATPKNWNEDAPKRFLPREIVPVRAGEVDQRLEDKIQMPDWEKHFRQDRERRFFEWRTG